MSLTNPNKVVTEQRLNEYHNTIFPYLGGMPEMVANKFSKGDLYSTEEKMIGQWIDGKPLYQKILNITDLPNNSTKNISIDSSFIVQILNAYACGSNGAVFPIQHEGDTTIQNINHTINLKATYNMAEYGYTNVTVILQYTKTTDSPISIGSDTDYSTEEKIVGTWIDGKPLYQKTIDCGTMPNNTAKNVVHNITNIDKIVTFYGSATRPSDNLTVLLPSFTIYNPNTGANYGIEVTANKTQITLYVVTDRSGFINGYVTLQYTKTTD